MGNRTYSWNAYESELVGTIDATTASIEVTSALGLTAPCYLVIDPENGVTREYIKVTSINVNTLTAIRGEDGSVGGAGNAHDAGAKVRAVPVHQWLNDIFDDVESLETGVPDHEAAPNPHPVYLTQTEGDGLYLSLAGGTLTGAINMGGNKVTNLLDGAAASQDAASVTQMEAADSATLGLANGYSNGLDHDHATPIAAHDGDAAAHGVKDDTNPHNHDRYTDDDAQDVGDALYLPLGANAVSASKWVTARTITVTLAGDLSGSGNASVDGTANKTITVTGVVANDSHTHYNTAYAVGTSVSSSQPRIVRSGSAASGTALNGTLWVQY